MEFNYPFYALEHILRQNREVFRFRQRGKERQAHILDVTEVSSRLSDGYVYLREMAFWRGWNCQKSQDLLSLRLPVGLGSKTLMDRWIVKSLVEAQKHISGFFAPRRGFSQSPSFFKAPWEQDEPRPNLRIFKPIYLMIGLFFYWKAPTGKYLDGIRGLKQKQRTEIIASKIEVYG